MIGSEDQKTTIDRFRGLYNRGSVDEVPPDHAQDCLNCMFTSESRYMTRSGSTQALTVGGSHGVRRFFQCEASPPNYNEPVANYSGTTDGFGLLVMDSAGNLYLGNSASIGSFAGTPDFAAINIANRTFVSPNNGQGGYLLGRLQILDATTGVLRDAAGLAPRQTISGNFTAANSVTAGVVPAGVHQFAVIYQTNTGFWTPPGPKYVQTVSAAASVSHTAPTILTLSQHGLQTGESHQISGATGAFAVINNVWHITKIDNNTFSIPVDTFGLAVAGTILVDGMVQFASVTADGTHAVDLSGIPIGPSQVTDRLILATRANETEFFFIPNVPGCVSDIADNTSTTTTVNFNDTDLVDSADYLFDLLETIPGGGGLTKYRGRLCVAGPYFPGNQERVILSNVNDPETFSFVTGYVQVQTERDGNNVTTAWVLRDTLYMSKFTGLFSTEDNGSEPSTWSISVIDAIVGTYNYGTSAFTVSQPAADTGDIVLLAARPGLYLFDGVVRRPELSWKIQSTWLRINFSYFYKVTVAHDPWNHLIYVSVPLDSATDPNTLLVCDYSDGRSYDVVRWSIWSFPWSTTCIGMLYFVSSAFTPQRYTLLMGSVANQHIFALDSTQTTDNGTKILNYYTLGPVTYGQGGLNQFKMYNFRAWGVGKFTVTIAQEDGAGAQTPPAFTLTPLPGKELQRLTNLTGEKMTLKFANGNGAGSPGDYATVDRVDIWGHLQWPMRPSV